jgi:hypothetical protein
MDNTSTIVTDQARLFQELIVPFFSEFTETFLPDMATFLDKKSISFVEAINEEKTASTENSSEVDLLFKARYKGQECLFLVHVEQQAQRQVKFGYRMFSKFARLHEKNTLPIYPIALFVHSSPWPEPYEYLVNFQGFDILHFQYRVVQLSRMRWQGYVQRANPIACTLASRMSMDEADKPQVKLKCLLVLHSLKLIPTQIRWLASFIDQSIKLDAMQSLTFKELLASLADSPEKNFLMETITSWTQEGIETGKKLGFQAGKQEGHKQGFEEGKHEGRQDVLCQVILRQLKHRFGDMNPVVEARMRALPQGKLEGLIEAVVDFKALTDLKDWLASGK